MHWEAQLADLISMSTNKNILAEGIEITGTIKFRNDMIIDGKVEGEIQSDEGSLTIGENARIKGDIHTCLLYTSDAADE